MSGIDTVYAYRATQYARPCAVLIEAPTRCPVLTLRMVVPGHGVWNGGFQHEQVLSPYRMLCGVRY
eukprot:537183-Rhodomonas_salina.2